MISGGVITYRPTGQAAKSNNTAEAETKAIAIAVAMGLRSRTYMASSRMRSTGLCAP